MGGRDLFSKGFRRRLVEAICVNLCIAVLLVIIANLWPKLVAHLTDPTSAVILITWAVVLVQLPTMAYFSVRNFEWAGWLWTALYILRQTLMAVSTAFCTALTCLLLYWTVRLSFFQIESVTQTQQLVALVIFAATFFMWLLVNLLVWATFMDDRW